MKKYELNPIFDGSKSFYKKANVLEDGSKKALISYSTKVAEIIDGVAIVYGTYSKTTLRHIREFLRQNGFMANNKAQIECDYMKGAA